MSKTKIRARPCMIGLRAISPRFGVEVLGVDLGTELDEATKAGLRQAWHEHGLLLFRGRSLSERDLDRAACIFGEISLEGGELVLPTSGRNAEARSTQPFAQRG